MKQLNLKATTQPQKLIKEYLEQNASDVLTDKINNGVQVQKYGKTLINKKTLDGFMKYANGEARKLAEKGANYACIEDNIVFGWAIHYFEEDSIEEQLYNEDGTKYTPTKATSKKKDSKQKNVNKPEPKPGQKPAVVERKSSNATKPTKNTTVPSNQMSFFDML